MKLLKMIWHSLTMNHQWTTLHREQDRYGFTSITEKCDGCGYTRYRWGKIDE